MGSKIIKIKDAQFIKGAPSWDHLVTDGKPEVGFIGRSNVGKSSLLNMLVQRKALARVSNTPGKTREFNYYLINHKLYLVDLPGYGYAKVSKPERARWTRLIGRYLTERETLKLTIHLVDSRHPPTELDREVMLLTQSSEAPYLLAMTKSDKLNQSERARSERRIQEALNEQGLEAPVIFTSAAKKVGGDAIWKWILDLT